MSGYDLLEVVAGSERVRADGFAVDFGEAAGAPVVVTFAVPAGTSASATLHVYPREIADGDLMCSLGPRRAAVTFDIGLAARIVAEALARGLVLPEAEARALTAALR